MKRRQLLKDVASLPVTAPEYPTLTEISELVIIGDRAKDEEYLRLLEDVVGPGSIVKKSNATTCYDGADPVFTCVSGQAEN